MNEVSPLLEILNSKDKTLATDIKEAIPQLTSKIERLKSDVKAFVLGDNRVSSHVNVSNNFVRQVKDVNGEMKNLDEKITTACESEVDKTLLNIQNLEHELKKSKYSLQLANYFVDFHETYKQLCKLIKDKEYVEAVKKLSETLDIIKSVPCQDNLDIIESMKIDIDLQRTILEKNLSDIWYHAVKIENKIDKNIQIIKIEIDNNTYDLSKVIAALYQNNSTSKFDCFADYLLNSVLSLIINNTVKIQVLRNNDSEILDMRVKVDSPKMHYDLLFDNLLTVFDYLCVKIDYVLDTDLTLVSYIGNRNRKKFCDILIKNYLNELVPSTEEEFDNYKNVVKRIEALNLQLKSNGFFDEESCQLLENAGNIELVYADKISQNYLAKANVIFKKDLHDMVEVSLELELR